MNFTINILLFIVFIGITPTYAEEVAKEPTTKVDASTKSTDAASEPQANKDTQPKDKTLSFDKIYNIRIVEASWGLNCDGKKKKNAEDFPDNEKMHHVKANNIGEKIKSICDGKKECSFKPNKETISPDPAPECKKKMQITYRCFSYDNPRHYSGRPSSKTEITLNCDVKDK